MNEAPRAELVLYATEDGTVWLTQLELAYLFQTSKQNISLHIRNVLADAELQVEAVVKQDLTTAADGKR